MAKVETAASTPRAPRGTKPVAQAFLTALDTVPEASRSAVAKAAQAMIRDQLKNRRDKLKAATAKEKARRATASGRSPKSAESSRAGTHAQPEPEKRRSRKRSDVPAAA